MKGYNPTRRQKTWSTLMYCFFIFKFQPPYPFSSPSTVLYDHTECTPLLDDKCIGNTEKEYKSKTNVQHINALIKYMPKSCKLVRRIKIYFAQFKE